MTIQKNSHPIVRPLIPETKALKQLIPDLLPTDHVSLNMKRIRFIQGQGVVLYDDTFAVEIYLPSGGETPTSFGVHRHNGKVSELKRYFLKPMVMHFDDARTTEVMRQQFEEAVFQFLPLAINDSGWIIPAKINNGNLEGKEVVMYSNLSGAA